MVFAAEDIQRRERDRATFPAPVHRLVMDREFRAGDVLQDRFEIRKRLHRARDKSIYLGYDRKFDCQVTIDVFSGSKRGTTMAAWETRLLGKLGDHPNIARVVHHWEDGETAIMVNRYLPGGSLQDLILRSRGYGVGLAIDRIMRVSSEIANGLAHIHRNRILYCDLRPRNVRFDEFGTVRLVDFDTAVRLGQSVPAELVDRLMAEYVAPEVAEGQSADERADLYSLGVTVYEMAAGYPPFTGTRDEIAAARRMGPPPGLDRNDLPEALRGLIFSLLEVDPDKRPVSAAEVIELLQDMSPRRAAAAPAASDTDHLPQPNAAELQESGNATATAYTVGDLLDDRFEILEIVDEGAFAKVYRVRDVVEDEERALKLFNSVAGYQAVLRELRALRKIRDPHVVEVYWASKTRSGEWYLISEFVRGVRLDEFTNGNRWLSDREAIDVALDLLSALVAFHPDPERLRELDIKRREGELSEDEYLEWRELSDKGLVHRDIKPLNVILTRSGAKLLDFNIASRVGDEVRTRSGTPPYQPPEADLTRWDVSPDLFAVGVILYQLLCDGQHPYANAQPMVDEPVIDPRTFRRDLKPGLASFLSKACASDRATRFTTAVQMRDALLSIRAEM